ncbi:MAG: peptide chain release factor N(5)-glutamine methyltransferase [Chitinophagaceae bacterium]|nr:peptide chain release factor N(5)-glutamine methyltransferase [Chitinophagaceae bacterium]
MTLREAGQHLLTKLGTLYEPGEAQAITTLVMEHITGLKKIDRFLVRDEALPAEKQHRLEEMTEQLCRHRPVQYVLGEAWFAGMRFYVDENVLIPRPETEELIQWATDTCKAKPDAGSALDIGTGSGCISISFKIKNPGVDITALDVSTAALKIARFNAEKLGAGVNWIPFDFLEEKNWERLPAFDIILSNPPYVKQSERPQMAEHVLQFEPALALFVPDEDALLFYRKIAVFGKTHLNKGGVLFLEINESLGYAVTGLFSDHGYRTQLRKDLHGRDRMVKAWKDKL